MEDDARVHVAGARAHDEALQGCHAHRGVVGETVLDRVDGGSVADVRDDQIRLERVFAQEDRRALGVVEEARTVEAVAAHGVLVPPFARYGVAVGEVGHSLMPGGIHDRAVRRVGQDRLGGLHAHQVGGVVQRREIGQVAEGGEEIVVDEDRPGELRAAVDHPMADGLDPRHVFYDAALGGDQRAEDELDRDGMGGALVLEHVIGLSAAPVRYGRAPDGHALDDARREGVLPLPIVYLIFHG
jgi:hypothetical protein